MENTLLMQRQRHSLHQNPLKFVNIYTQIINITFSLENLVNSLIQNVEI